MEKYIVAWMPAYISASGITLIDQLDASFVLAVHTYRHVKVRCITFSLYNYVVTK